MGTETMATARTARGRTRCTKEETMVGERRRERGWGPEGRGRSPATRGRVTLSFCAGSGKVSVLADRIWGAADNNPEYGFPRQYRAAPPFAARAQGPRFSDDRSGPPSGGARAV